MKSGHLPLVWHFLSWLMGREGFWLERSLARDAEPEEWARWVQSGSLGNRVRVSTTLWEGPGPLSTRAEPLAEQGQGSVCGSSLPAPGLGTEILWGCPCPGTKKPYAQGLSLSLAAVPAEGPR